MPSRLERAWLSFWKRNSQQIRTTVGDVLLENTIASANLKVKPVLKGNEGDPGYYSQPLGYTIVASFKGAARICQVPASHDGVPHILVTDSKSTRVVDVWETGLQLTGVRIMEVPLDDPMVEPRGVVLRLTFTQSRTGRTPSYDFYLN